ncbi:hypothetical protein MKY91_05810 [Alkalicoccobacillus gibsonii]|uniref:Cyclophilin-like domain-containing protein n=1 Tax=Alkalicoccobacillus gibsonii TaxID=79881 RepID=A0ABU9VFP9_9BACI
MMTCSTIEFHFSNGIRKQSLIINQNNEEYTTFLGKLPTLFSFEDQIGVNKISYSNRDLLLITTSPDSQDLVTVSFKHSGQIIILGTFLFSVDEMSQTRERFQVLIDVAD